MEKKLTQSVPEKQLNLANELAPENTDWRIEYLALLASVRQEAKALREEIALLKGNKEKT